MTILRISHIFASIVAIGFMPSTWAEAQVGKSNFDEKFEQQRENAIKKIEKSLATPGGAHEETWYVLHFIDVARRAENTYNSPYSGRRYWSATARDSSRAEMVLGRRKAAEMIFEFDTSPSKAVQDLPPTPYPSELEFQKRCVPRAFRSAAEAEFYYQRIKPPSKSNSAP